MDRGIVSEENLAANRQRGGQYLVGTPRSQMKQFEAELVKDDWIQVRPVVEVKKVAIPNGKETYILCRTCGRKEREQAIRPRFSRHMEDPGWPSSGERSPRSCSARYRRGHSFALGRQRREQGLARPAGRRVHVAPTFRPGRAEELWSR
jgi:hypothetical protein